MPTLIDCLQGLLVVVVVLGAMALAEGPQPTPTTVCGTDLECEQLLCDLDPEGCEEILARDHAGQRTR